MTAPLHNMPAWLQCDGKEPFESPALAARIAKRRSASKKFRGKPSRPLNAYHCPHCGLFHIGGVGK